MYRKIINFFDKFEDGIRIRLSKFPVVYTILGGVSIVLFWRGVWHTADTLESKGGWIGFLFTPHISILVVILVLLATGLFVSAFIGDAILLSGLKQEKKLHEKTEKEVREGENKLNDIKETVLSIKKDVEILKETVEHNDTANNTTMNNHENK